ncbi:ABC transporter permease [Aureimonas fodinaquatilis]|uniref:ABC transporter permease n=1 Tax=Aureimonas fodinaquatilis TaxID=2565783 RepID=A0A5B0E0N5_9HYPH|nr:ABC transporter permease [Aureimonas fodinaquatilis]KAA0971852.1 ABC transporter permease [Aureimonas fodinaquatilis]
MALHIYLFKRLFYTLPLLACAITTIFFLIHAAPGDPVDYLIGEAGASQEMIDRLRAQMGLDQPVYIRLWNYAMQVLGGNLGYSVVSGAPVLSLILDRFPATLLLMATQYTIAAIVGIGLGVLAARNPQSRTDNVITFISLASFAIPVFWLGQMMILILAYHMNWFPIQGMTNLRRGYTGIDYTLDVAYHMTLPALTLALSNLGLITRLTRSSMIQVLSQDYVKVARAKGLSERAVLLRHALRNSLLPVITVIGDSLPGLIAGAVIVETVFGWPGLGRLTLDAINSRDYPLLMGMFLFISVFVIIINLIVDLLYAVLDPRIRYQ